MPDGEDTHEALYHRVDTFRTACADAFIMGFQSEGNWTCQEVETPCDLLDGIATEQEMDDLRRAHAAWPGHRNAGDCECEDEHHQLWVNEHGTCDGCDLEPEEATDGFGEVQMQAGAERAAGQ